MHTYNSKAVVAIIALILLSPLLQMIPSANATASGVCHFKVVNEAGTTLNGYINFYVALVNQTGTHYQTTPTGARPNGTQV